MVGIGPRVSVTVIKHHLKSVNVTFLYQINSTLDLTAVKTPVDRHL